MPSFNTAPLAVVYNAKTRRCHFARPAENTDSVQLSCLWPSGLESRIVPTRVDESIIMLRSVNPEQQVYSTSHDGTLGARTSPTIVFHEKECVVPADTTFTPNGGDIVLRGKHDIIMTPISTLSGVPNNGELTRIAQLPDYGLELTNDEKTAMKDHRTGSINDYEDLLAIQYGRIRDLQEAINTQDPFWAASVGCMDDTTIETATARGKAQIGCIYSNDIGTEESNIILQAKGAFSRWKTSPSARARLGIDWVAMMPALADVEDPEGGPSSYAAAATISVRKSTPSGPGLRDAELTDSLVEIVRDWKESEEVISRLQRYISWTAQEQANCRKFTLAQLSGSLAEAVQTGHLPLTRMGPNGENESLIC